MQKKITLILFYVHFRPTSNSTVSVRIFTLQLKYLMRNLLK